jgi:hypothetical protein
MTTPSSADEDSGALFRSLGGDLGRLVRHELQSAQDELVAKARRAGRGGLLLGGAGALGAVTTGMAGVLVLRVLDGLLPKRTAALVATLLAGAGTAGLAALGIAELRRALPVVPADTVRSVQSDVRAAERAAGTPPPPEAGRI